MKKCRELIMKHFVLSSVEIYNNNVQTLFSILTFLFLGLARNVHFKGSKGAAIQQQQNNPRKNFKQPTFYALKNTRNSSLFN